MNFELIVELFEKELLTARNIAHVNAAARDAYKNDYQRAQTKREELQNSLEKLQLERDELQKDLQEQIDAGIWIKQEADKIRKERDELKAERDSLQRFVETDAEVMRDLRSAGIALQKEVDDLRNHRNKLQAENNQIIMERDQLQIYGASNRQLLSKTEALQSLVDELKLENKIAAKQNAELQKFKTFAIAELQRQNIIVVGTPEDNHE